MQIQDASEMPKPAGVRWCSASGTPALTLAPKQRSVTGKAADSGSAAPPRPVGGWSEGLFLGASTRSSPREPGRVMV